MILSSAETALRICDHDTPRIPDHARRLNASGQPRAALPHTNPGKEC